MAEQKYPEPTVGALIINPAIEILLVDSHKWEDQYTIPGGHVELGESLEEAVIREAREETGLKVSAPEFLCYQEFIYGESFWQERHFIFFDFLCRTDETEVVLNEEAEGYLWIEPVEALGYPLSPFLDQALRVYLDRINQK